MFEITKEVSIEDLLEKIEEVTNIGICALVFALVAIVIIVMLVCAFFEIDKVNDKKIAKLDDLLAQEIEKNRVLEYKVRFFCDRAVYLPTDNGKKGKKK